MWVRIGPFHISWGWQVHTDLILYLETFARPHTRFICGSPAGLHRGDGWSGNRWPPVKHQQPELLAYLSIKSSTGCTTACSWSGLVTVNSHNWPWTLASRWREAPFWRQMEMGADLFHAVVNWVVIFEPLVKKIGCDDKEMWDAYLLVSGSSNFFCISRELARPCKNDAILCHASVKQPLFEMKVYIWAGEEGGWDTSICFASCKCTQTYAKRKCHPEWAGCWWLQCYHFMWLWDSSSFSNIMESDGGFLSLWWSFCVNMRINSMRLPLVTDHFDFLEIYN